ncbi:MAG: ABC transporter permease [Inquilinus sp.]|nr:ABC transporter permease [Inquilinus sp.]
MTATLHKTPTAAAPRASPLAVLGRVEGLPIVLVFLLVIAVFMVLAPNTFLGDRIYKSLLITLPPLLIVGLGLTLVIAAGEIDLSFPSVIALSGFVFAACYRFDQVPILAFLAEGLEGEALFAMKARMAWVGMVLAIVVGGLVGAVNGLLIARIGIPSIIATLATQFLWRGVAVVVAGGLSYSLRGVKQAGVWQVTSGRLLDWFPMQAVWALAIAVVLWFVLNRHRFGEALLFIGDNQQVARVMGIDVAREKTRLFVLMGLLGGVAGVFLTAENITFYTNQGQGYLLLVMAAVFIGGTSIFGGSGTIVGTVFGVLIVLVVQAGIVAAGVGGFWNDVVIGLIFIAAVVFHLAVERPGRFKGFGISPGR